MIRLVSGCALLGAVVVVALKDRDCRCALGAADRDGFCAKTNGTVKNAITATARATVDVFILLASVQNQIFRKAASPLKKLHVRHVLSIAYISLPVMDPRPGIFQFGIAASRALR